MNSLFSCKKCAVGILTFLVLISLLISTAKAAETCIPDSKLLQNLQASSQGSVLNLTMTNSSLNIISCEELSTNKTIWTGGNLILSDSPEYPSTRGKLYEDQLPKTTTDNPHRIFMYHVNGKSEGSLLRFTILIRNLNPIDNAVLKVLKTGMTEPTLNYLYAGKLAFQRWLESNSTSEYIIPPLGVMELDPSVHSLLVDSQFLIHGIWDYSINQEHIVTICALEPEDDTIEACLGSQMLPRDAHVRGTFPFSNKIVNINQSFNNSTPNGLITQFPVGDGISDQFSIGVDSTDGSVQVNIGNYGIVYLLNISSDETFTSDLVSYLINPRGGGWAGAVDVTDGGIFLLPEGTGSVFSNTQGALIGTFDARANVEIMFMPVGGSSFPVRVVSVLEKS